MVGTAYRMEKVNIAWEITRSVIGFLTLVVGTIVAFLAKSWIVSYKESNAAKKLASESLQKSVNNLVSETRELRGDMQGIRAEMHNSANALNAKIDEKISGVTVQLQEIKKELKEDITDIRQRVNLLEDIKRA